MKCKRCDEKLTGQQKSYCSKYCSKLHLKSLYRKRNKDIINKYKKTRRHEGKELKSVSRPSEKFSLLKEGAKCRSCKSLKNLTVNHIIPLSIGGNNDLCNLEILCARCNSREYHLLVKKALKAYFNL